MRALRAAKPWLFGGSSSSSAMAPRAEAAAGEEGDGDERGRVAGGAGRVVAAAVKGARRPVPVY